MFASAGLQCNAVMQRRGASTASFARICEGSFSLMCLFRYWANTTSKVNIRVLRMKIPAIRKISKTCAPVVGPVKVDDSQIFWFTSRTPMIGTSTSQNSGK